MKKTFLASVILLTSLFVSAQKIEVKEDNVKIGGAKNPALVVTIYEADKSTVEKAWKSLMKDYGAKVTGVTVHFVDEQVDHGAIIAQEPVAVRPKDTIESLAKRVHKAEHALYPRVIDLFLRGKLKVAGRKVTRA